MCLATMNSSLPRNTSPDLKSCRPAIVDKKTCTDDFDPGCVIVCRTPRILFLLRVPVAIRTSFVTIAMINFSCSRPIALTQTGLEFLSVIIPVDEKIAPTLRFMTKVSKSTSTASSFTTPNYTRTFKSAMCRCRTIPPSSANGLFIAVRNIGAFQC